MSAPDILELRIQVSRRLVERALGYGAGAPRQPRITPTIEEMSALAQDLVRPRGGFRIVDGHLAEEVGMPDPTERVALGLCTLGPDLEAEGERRSRRGRQLEALLLDAYGSAAAEAAADSLCREIAGRACREGLRGEPRISPGYGRWDLAHQTALLGLLPAEELGIRLTPGIMMRPRKTVSFGQRLHPVDTEVATPGPPCKHCGMERCHQRRPPEER